MFFYCSFANIYFLIFEKLWIAFLVVLAGVIVFSIINLIIYRLMPNIIKKKTLALAQTKDGDGT